MCWWRFGMFLKCCWSVFETLWDVFGMSLWCLCDMLKWFEGLLVMFWGVDLNVRLCVCFVLLVLLLIVCWWLRFWCCCFYKFWNSFVFLFGQWWRFLFMYWVHPPPINKQEAIKNKQKRNYPKHCGGWGQINKLSNSEQMNKKTNNNATNTSQKQTKYQKRKKQVNNQNTKPRNPSK